MKSNSFSASDRLRIQPPLNFAANGWMSLFDAPNAAPSTAFRHPLSNAAGLSSCGSASTSPARRVAITPVEFRPVFADEFACFDAAADQFTCQMRYVIECITKSIDKTPQNPDAD